MVPMDENQLPAGGTDSGSTDDDAWLAAWDALPREADAANADLQRAADALGAEAAAFGRLRQRIARVPLPEVAPGVRDAVLRVAEAELADDPLESWEAARAGADSPWAALQRRIAAQPLPDVASSVRETVLREATERAALAQVSDDTFLATVAAAREGHELAGVPAALAREARQIAAVQARVGELPLPEVKPAVRSAVLGAAIESAAALEEAGQPLWKRWLSSLMQPGPLAVGGLAFALAVAFAVRPSQAPAPTATEAEPAPQVAVAEIAAEREVASRPVAPEAVAAAPAAVGAGAVAAAPAEAAPAPVAAEPAAVAKIARPQRAIAANPASLGPTPEAQVAKQEAEYPAQLARSPVQTNNAGGSAEKVAATDDQAVADSYARAAGATAVAPSAAGDEAARESVINKAVEAKMATLRKEAEALPVGSRGDVLAQLEQLARMAGSQSYLDWTRKAQEAERAAKAPIKRAAAPVAPPSGKYSVPSGK